MSQSEEMAGRPTQNRACPRIVWLRQKAGTKGSVNFDLPNFAGDSFDVTCWRALGMRQTTEPGGKIYGARSLVAAFSYTGRENDER